MSVRNLIWIRGYSDSTSREHAHEDPDKQDGDYFHLEAAFHGEVVALFNKYAFLDKEDRAKVLELVAREGRRTT